MDYDESNVGVDEHAEELDEGKEELLGARDVSVEGSQVAVILDLSQSALEDTHFELRVLPFFLLLEVLQVIGFKFSEFAFFHIELHHYLQSRRGRFLLLRHQELVHILNLAEGGDFVLLNGISLGFLFESDFCLLAGALVAQVVNLVFLF